MALDPVATGNAIVDSSTYVDSDNLHRLLAEVRNKNPVMYVEPTNFRPFWLVSKYHDIREVESKPARFLNRPRSFLVSREEEEGIFAATGEYVTTRSVIQVDGDEHRKLRGITQSWFMPGTVAKMDATIRTLANAIIDDLMVNPGPVDFANDVAAWYPLKVIAMILGLPDEATGFMLDVTRQTFSSADPDLSEADQFATVQKSQQRVTEYFARITEDRRRNPTDDVASVIANARIDGKLLTEMETASYYFTLVTAGHDTTSSTLAGGMLALAQHPEELAKLQRNPELIRKSAIDEFLRWTTPIKHFFRTAIEDYELRGRPIKAGDSLMMCYPSANRDEDVFEDPFAFRVDRRPNAHLAFGYGAHLCLGMHLAKLELAIFFEELLPRLESVSLAGEPALTRANFVQSMKRLPLNFVIRPRGEAAAAQRAAAG